MRGVRQNRHGHRIGPPFLGATLGPRSRRRRNDPAQHADRAAAWPRRLGPSRSTCSSAGSAVRASYSALLVLSIKMLNCAVDNVVHASAEAQTFPAVVDVALDATKVCLVL